MNKILVVEDDAAIRGILQELFQDEGFVVATAEDGEKALNILQQESGWIIFTDLNMPKMDGTELIKRLERNCRWQQENIVAVMSAQRLTAEQIISYLSSEIVKALLPKPFDLSTLLELAEILKRQLNSIRGQSCTRTSQVSDLTEERTRAYDPIS